MLSRPEIGTNEHVLLWLAGKPENEEFWWGDSSKCAFGQYKREHGVNEFRTSGLWAGSKSLNNIASKIARQNCGWVKFGELYTACRKVWAA